MMQERQVKTVAAVIKSKAEAEDGFKLEVDIPEFKSDYPTLLTRVSGDIAAQLKIGAVYNLRLEKQNPKRGKSADSTREYDYYWGLQGIAGEADKLPEREDNHLPDRQDLIMLQHASHTVAQAYGDWKRLTLEFPSIFKMTFFEYLKDIAQANTWYLKNVYQKGGYFTTNTTETPPVASYPPSASSGARDEPHPAEESEPF